MLQMLLIGVGILAVAFALPYFGIDLRGLVRDWLARAEPATRPLPEELGDLLRDSNQRIRGLEKSLEQLQSAVADSHSCSEPAPPRASPSELEDIHRRLEELADHIGAVRNLAEARGEEVERLREGRDFAATRAFARGVIKAIDLLQDFQRQLSEWRRPRASSPSCSRRTGSSPSPPSPASPSWRTRAASSPWSGARPRWPRKSGR
jgi:hypothetical protein